MRKLVGLIVLVGVGVGCDEVKSDDIDTSGIYASMSVTGLTGGNALASAVLRVGDATSTAFLDLQSGDTLTATDGTTTLGMEDLEIIEFHSYNATFDETTAGALYTIAFDRTGKEPAPTSTATMPDAFEFTAPPATMSGAQDVTLAWEPSGTSDEMRLDFSGDCINPESIPVTGDPGTYTLAAGTLEQAATDADDPGCDVTATLTRSRAGTLDAAFGGGAIVGQQSRFFVASFTR